MGVDEDLWKAASNGKLADFQKHLRNKGKVTCVVKEKTCLQIATENMDLQLRTFQTAKANEYQQVIDCLRVELNKLVVEAANQGLVKRLEELHKAGGDLYQANPNVACVGVIQLAATTETDDEAKASVELILNLEPRSFEGITYSCDEHKSYGIHKLAEDKGNKKTSKYLHLQLTRLLMNCPMEQDGIRKLRRLSDIGIDVNHVDQSGNAVLFLAIMNRNLPMVKELVENLNAMTTLKKTEGEKKKSVVDLCKELEPREPELEKYLIQILVNQELLRAIEEEGGSIDLQNLKEKLVQGFNPNCHDKNGNTPVMLAIKFGCPSAFIKELVQSHSADLEAVNQQGHRALELAILSMNLAVVGETLTIELGVDVVREVKTVLELIIQLGADLKRKDTQVLKFAEAHEKPKAIEILKEVLEEKLLQVVLNDDIEKVKELVTCGVDINAKFMRVKTEYARDRKGWTSLQIAVDRGNIRMIIVLYEYGARLNDRVDSGNWAGTTTLSLACEKGDKEVVQLLLDIGANIHLKDDNEDGNTPLITAVMNNQSEIVPLLLLYGADETKTNDKGMSAVQLAKEQSIQIIFQKLDIGNLTHKCVDQSETRQDRHDLEKDSCPPVTLPDLTIKPIKMIPIGDIQTNEELLNAAKNGNWINVEKAIHAGADIRYRSKDGKTGPAAALEFEKKYRDHMVGLFSSASDKQVDLQKAEACKIVAKNFFNRATYMVWDAIEKETLERVQTLHEFGANIGVSRDTQDPLGVPGMLVRNQDKPDILNYLVETDKKNYTAILVRNTQNESCLSIAKEKGHRGCVEYLVARISKRLRECVYEYDFTSCEYFTKLGAVPDMNESGKELNSSILCAIENNNFEIVKLLAEAGSDLKTVSVEVLEGVKNRKIMSYLNTKRLSQFLRDAVRKETLDEVKQFHQKGGQINDRNYCGDSSVDIAVRTGNFGIVHYLLSRGGSIVCKNKQARTNIRQAELLGNQDMVKYLQSVATERFEQALRAGDIDELDQLLAMPNFTIADHKINGETPATLAVMNHGIDLIKWLWKQNIPLDKPNENEDYPLGLAAVNGDFAVVYFLVQECKLSKNVEDKDGKTPLKLAEDAGWKIVAEFLNTGRIDKQKVKEDQPKLNRRELLTAVRKAKIGIIKQFIAEKYQHRELKINCCQSMISEAELLQAEEIRVMLENHLRELQEDTSDFKLTGSKKSQRILDGFLDALEKILTGINMDAKNDDLSKRAGEKTKQLYSDVAKLQEDISDHLQDTSKRKKELDKKMEEITDPAERIATRNEIMKLYQQVKTSNAALTILERKQRTVTEKQKAIQIFKKNKHQYKFFETICTKIDSYLINIKLSFSNKETDKQDQNETKIRLHTVSGEEGANFEIVKPAYHSSEDKVIKSGFRKIKSVIKTQIAYAGLEEVDSTSLPQDRLDMWAVHSELDHVITNAAYRLTMFYQVQLKNMRATAYSDNESQRPSELFGCYCSAWVIHGFLSDKYQDSNVNAPLAQQFVKHITTSDAVDIGSEGTKIAHILLKLAGIKVELQNSQEKTTSSPTLSNICTAGSLVVPSDGVYANVYVRENNKIRWEDIGYYYGTKDMAQHYVYVKEDESKNKKQYYAYDDKGTEIELDQENNKGILKQLKAIQTDLSCFVEDDDKRIVKLETRKQIQDHLKKNQDELSELAKQSEASAKDWSSHILQTVKHLEGDMKDKVKMFQDTTEKHEKTVDNRVTGHVKQTDYKLKQAVSEQRLFAEKMNKQFSEYQQKMDEQCAKHTEITEKAVEKHEKTVNNRVTGHEEQTDSKLKQAASEQTQFTQNMTKLFTEYHQKMDEQYAKHQVNVEDTVKHHEKTVDNRATEHEKQTNNTLNQAASEQRIFEENMTKQFEEYQHKMDEKYAKHQEIVEQKLQDIEKKLVDQQNDFTKHLDDMFEQFKKEQQQQFNELNNNNDTFLKNCMDSAQMTLDGKSTVIQEQARYAFEVSKAAEKKCLEAEKKSADAMQLSVKTQGNAAEIARAAAPIAVVQKLEARLAALEGQRGSDTPTEYQHKMDEEYAKHHVRKVAVRPAALERQRGSGMTPVSD